MPSPHTHIPTHKDTIMHTLPRHTDRVEVSCNTGLQRLLQVHIVPICRHLNV